MTRLEADALAARIRACRLCIESPAGPPLPHEPRPVLQVSRNARLAIFGQAPGVRVHASGRPFTDPSGVRLRRWLGISEEVFYNASIVAIAPMGFCFPGQDSRGGDLPPRRECAARWRHELMTALPDIKTAILVGSYAQAWHLGEAAAGGLTATVRRWRDFAPRYFPTPHPSWRNNAWLKNNSWFEAELLPAMKSAVARVIASPIHAS
ncbi:MAG: uracil-DNA glycosylase family protein [Parvularculaceae bacterium]